MKLLSSDCYVTFLLLIVATTTTSVHSIETSSSSSEENECGCKLMPRPDKAEKAKTARWMAHSLSWGTLSTISTRLGDAFSPVPFGNTYSFVDGPCNNATGIPYFYGTYMDQSFLDTLDNPTVSLSLSEASLSSVCTNRDGLTACQLGTKYGDPENPVCARVAITGKLTVLEEGSDEFQWAQSSIFHRHSTMEYWPANHNWVIGKIDPIEDVWLIDYFGGAAILTGDEYLSVDLAESEQDFE